MKTYDIRGKLDRDLTPALAYRFGRAFAQVLGNGPFVIGHDCRLSSPALHNAFINGVRHSGGDVFDLGQSGTEEVYFAVSHLRAAGGVEVTASHNPIDYNGFKFVGAESRPLPQEVFCAICDLAETAQFSAGAAQGAYRQVDTRADYAAHIAQIAPVGTRPLRLLVNAGNGVAGAAFDAIVARLAPPWTIHRINHVADGRFPRGIPNPLLPENRAETAQAVLDHGADIGIAWDGDFDRCFFFDEAGTFVDGEFIVGLLAQAMLGDAPGASIVMDRRVMLNITDAITASGGQPVLARAGHIFIKQAMRDTDALYGGEMSGHHYFRDFMFCDSGMIPWLKVAGLLSSTGQPLSQLVAGRKTRFCASGEMNFTVDDVAKVIARVAAHFSPIASHSDHADGLSMSFVDWRFNLRASSTEPLLRLNVETTAGQAACEAHTAQLRTIIEKNGGR
ncbi:phosphomannomutase [Rubricella aquisinus]|uniref:phosphomannomutase n=1 Tax=Rubricella aquisinus TaxID=2028108 RepID=UPI0031B5D5C7